MEFEKYLAFLQDLCWKLDSLSAVQNRKITAIQAGDLKTLEACMKQEQAATLSLRGWEKHRQELLRALGLEQVSLRDLPQHCPPEDKARTAALAEQVLRSYQVFYSGQQAARTLMESNLRHIQRELEQREAAQSSPADRKAQTDFRA